VKKTETDNMTI